MVSTGTIFDPAAIFTKGRVEVIDIETGEKVHVAAETAQHENIHSEGSPLTLRPEVGSYFFWSTSPPEGK